MEASQEKSLNLKLSVVLLLIISILFLGGCGGKREADELAYVLGIGIDKGKEEGTYLVTMQTAQPKASGGGAAELDNWTISVETPSLATTTERVAEAFDKQPFAGTVRVIVIGEDLAESGINEALDYFQRFYEFRRTVYLVVAKGKAKDIMETELRTRQIPSLSLFDTIEGQKRQSVFPITRLGHYLTVLGRESQNPLIPLVESIKSGEHGLFYPDEGAQEILIHESAVFDGGKLLATLNDQETKGYLWLDDEIQSRILEKGDGKGLKVTAWVLSSKTKYKVENIEGKMGIRFIIKAEVAINEIMGTHEQMNTKRWQQFAEELKPLLVQAIQEECEAAVAKSEKLKLDFIGIGRKIEIKKPKYWKEIKGSWPQGIADIPVAYDIEVCIKHAGLARNSPVSPQENGASGGSHTLQ
ncbi:Ger(x)C family spore germination protein [Desulfitobacterium sp. PCE1]|uniref:Ger(x)C family spore germination protein n=1 Tax=Desulfitobacterium sp. PCE1 TaxID=146907 RepID=UPI00036D0E49|nr:Ger(x)C family spore germination protein [Desulfitobacterium sp. PCE1]